MLTVKVVTLGLDDKSETFIFSGDRVVYSKRKSKNHLEEFPQPDGSVIVIGNLSQTGSEQEFEVATLSLFDSDGALDKHITILPHADCFVMDNGRTVSNFSVVYF